LAAQEQSEAASRQRREQEWASRLLILEQEEKQVLDLQSAPFRSYLMQNIMPTLSKALIQICKIHPQDPIDYLVWESQGEIQNDLLFSGGVFVYTFH
jgi:adenylate kinase